MKGIITAGVVGASSESVYAIEEAKKRGIKVIAVDGAGEAPGLAYADEGHVVDIRDIDAVFSFFDSNPIDFLLPVPVGRILTTSGEVNERYGLPGVRKKGTNFSTDKWAFHNMLAAEGLRNADAVLVDNINKIREIASMEFPIIFKPRYGSGSRDVKAYNTYEELLADADGLPIGEEDFIAETCKEGIEYGVDAVVLNGEYKMILLREKIITPPPYRQCVGYYALEKTEERKKMFESIDSLLEKSVKLLDIDDCLLHADVIYNGDEAFLIEISPRPSGHYLHNYFTRYACGFDMLGAYIDFAGNAYNREKYKIDYTYNAESMLIRYFDLPEGIVEVIPESEEIEQMKEVVCYNNNLKPGDRLDKVTDGRSVMGRGFYIVKADSLKDCEAICGEIEKQFIIKEA